MKTLIVTKTEEMKDAVIEYLKENIEESILEYIISRPNFRMATKTRNEYRVWLNPNECDICGVTVDLVYLDDRLPLSCLESFMPLVGFNILKVKLINKPKDISI